MARSGMVFLSGVTLIPFAWIALIARILASTPLVVVKSESVAQLPSCESGSHLFGYLPLGVLIMR